MWLLAWTCHRLLHGHRNSENPQMISIKHLVAAVTLGTALIATPAFATTKTPHATPTTKVSHKNHKKKSHKKTLATHGHKKSKHASTHKTTGHKTSTGAWKHHPAA